MAALPLPRDTSALGNRAFEIAPQTHRRDFQTHGGDFQTHGRDFQTHGGESTLIASTCTSSPRLLQARALFLRRSGV